MSINYRYYLMAMLFLVALPVYAQGTHNPEEPNLENCTQSMNTQYARSPDGTQIAFDVTGHGPTLILLHGAFESRQRWHEVGYVDHLKDSYQVIAIDIRGHGQSDKPIDSTLYTTEKLMQDVLTVADTCDVQSFVLWGFSYGSNISRYLAAHSDRVEGVVLIGTTFGLGAEGEFRTSLEQMCAHWRPILQAQRDNTLDWNALSEQDRTALQKQNPALAFALLSAILEWSAILPKDLSNPALWLIGSEDVSAMVSLKEYQTDLSSSRVRARVFDGLNHPQTFTEIDKVLPAMLEFTHAVWGDQDAE